MRCQAGATSAVLGEMKQKAIDLSPNGDYYFPDWIETQSQWSARVIGVFQVPSHVLPADFLLWEVCSSIRADLCDLVFGRGTGVIG